MQYKIKKLLQIKLIFLLMLFLISSCSSKQDNKLLGSAIGAALGGLIGVQFGAGTGQLIMTALSAGAGAFLGDEIGGRLSDEDKISLNKSISKSAKFGELNQTYSWESKEKKINAFIKPISEIKADKGSCRNVKVELIDRKEKKEDILEVCFKNV